MNSVTKLKPSKTEGVNNARAPESIVEERTHAEKVQEITELSALGMLLGEEVSLDKITEKESEVDELLDRLKRGETLTGGATGVELDPLLSEDLSAQDLKKPQTRKVRILRDKFRSEFSSKIRQGLVEARIKEAKEGRKATKTNATFDILVDRDYQVECKTCGGEINASILHRYARLEKTAHKVKSSSLDDYRSAVCMQCGSVDNKIGKVSPNKKGGAEFGRVADMIVDSLLESTISSRKAVGRNFQVHTDEGIFPLYVQTSSGVKEVLSDMRNHRKTSIQTKMLVDSLLVAVTANESIERDEIEHIRIITENGEKIEISSNEIGGRCSKGGTKCLGMMEAKGGLLRCSKCGHEDCRRYYDLGNSTMSILSRKISGLRKDEAGIDEKNEDGSTKLEEWSVLMAGHILMSLDNSNDSLFSLLESHEENNANDGTILELSREMSFFLDKLSMEEDGLLIGYFDKETIPPMICEPRPWELDEEEIAKGGFMTDEMRNRFPIVPRESAHKRMDLGRITITEKSLEALNRVQSTSFSVNTKMVDYQEEAMISTIHESLEKNIVVRGPVDVEGIGSADSKKCFVVEFAADNSWKEICLPDVEQLRGWIGEIAFARRVLRGVSKGEFYHPCRFDHRGRMYSISTQLDPQGDDFSRGLIEFSEGMKLDEDGWKWMCISVAKLWEGFEDYGGAKKRSTFKELEESVTSGSELEKTLRKVASDPLGTIEVWSDGKEDLMRPKSEGFQRLAASVEFVRLLDSGGIGEVTGYPARQDASSNIFQHMSIMIEDAQMASKVNVTERSHPSDVYQEMSDVVEGVSTGLEGNKPTTTTTRDKLLKRLISPPPYGLGLEEEVGASIISAVSKRKFAKPTVLPRGYDAGHPAISSSYLTHNGKPGDDKGKGKIGWFTRWEIDDYFQTFRELLESMRKNPLGISSIEEALLEGFPSEYSEYLETLREMDTHDLNEMLKEGGIKTRKKDSRIKKIEKLVKNRIDEWGNGASSMIKETLGVVNYGRIKDEFWISLCEKDGHSNEHVVEIKSLYDWITKSQFGWCAHWNSILFDVLVENNVGEELHWDIAKYVTSAYMEAMSVVLPNHNRSKTLIKRMASKFAPLKWKISSDGVELTNIKLVDRTSKTIARRVTEGSGPTLSIRAFKPERAPDKEKSASAPNFVHSLDAAHMRSVIMDVTNHQKMKHEAVQFWMVHDAFGCHPNHLGVLRESAAKRLGDVYRGGIPVEESHVVRRADEIASILKALEIGINEAQRVAVEDPGAEKIGIMGSRIIADYEMINSVERNGNGHISAYAKSIEELRTKEDGTGFVSEKGILDRVRDTAGHIGFGMVDFPGMSSESLRELNVEDLNKLLKERKMSKTGNKKEKIERLKERKIVFNSEYGDDFVRYNRHATEALGALLLLSDAIKPGLTARNNLDFLYIINKGMSIFDKRVASEGFGTLDLDEVTKSGNSEDWYFLM